MTNKKWRDFGSPVRQDEMEPVGFDLYGQHFDCYKQINGVVLLRFVSEANTEDNAKATGALLDIFKRVMNKDEYARFMTLCNDENTVVPVETLTEIIGFLIEAYTSQDRPTPESADS